MSIKWKIPLIAGIMFILNLVLLYNLSEFIFSPNITKKLSNMKENMYQTVLELIDSSEDMTLMQAKEYFESQALTNNYKLILKRFSDGEEFIYDYGRYNNILEAGENTTIEGQFYHLSIADGMDNSMIAKIDIVQQILILESFVVIIIFTVLTLFIYERSVKPLMRLDNLINSYNNNKTVGKRKLKDEIAEIENSFVSLTKSLEQEKQLQNQMIASISHDIKTPLTSVLGYSERLIKKDIEGEKKITYLQTIYKQALNIENILEEFDDYIINNDIKPELKYYDLSFISKLIEDEYTNFLNDKQIQLIVNDYSSGAKLLLDIKKIRRIFANLISNSIKHADVEHLKIEIKIYPEKILFIDNGKGVPEDIMNNIFKPFFTSDYSREISGLGLSICQNIMEQHGGSIEAKNTESGFVIILYFKK
jgi:signal transduction histidine kinase